jgi:hypothetical protein
MLFNKTCLLLHYIVISGEKKEELTEHLVSLEPGLKNSDVRFITAHVTHKYQFSFFYSKKKRSLL